MFKNLDKLKSNYLDNGAAARNLQKGTHKTYYSITVKGERSTYVKKTPPSGSR